MYLAVVLVVGVNVAFSHGERIFGLCLVMYVVYIDATLDMHVLSAEVFDESDKASLSALVSDRMRSAVAANVAAGPRTSEFCRCRIAERCSPNLRARCGRYTKTHSRQAANSTQPGGECAPSSE